MSRRYQKYAPYFNSLIEFSPPAADPAGICRQIETTRSNRRQPNSIRRRRDDVDKHIPTRIRMFGTKFQLATDLEC